MADNEPYGDVTYADNGMQADGKKRYPVDTEAHARAALSYFSKASNQAPYTASQIKTIMGRIMAACKKFGIEVSQENNRSGGGPDDVEERNTLVKVELRSVGGKGREIGGYAAVFGRESRQLGSFIETVAPCFFNKSRADGWPGNGSGVICRFNHDDFHMLGSTRSGTLRLTVDETGLDYSVDVPETRQDVFELISRGDINQSSIAMVVTQDDWSHNEAGYAQRTLIEGKLIDVSPVITPAYPDTTVALRSLARAKDAPEDEVAKLAERQELRKLFIRTDIDGNPQPERRPWSGAKARAYMRGKRPTDPFKRG